MDPNAMTQIGFLVLFILVMYLLLIRPQKKKEKAINEMRASVQVGDEIITIGGICGKVVKTKDESITIQVGADKVKFEIMRWGVSKIAESYGRTASSRRPRPTDEEEDTSDSRKPLPKRMRRVSEESDDMIDDIVEDKGDEENNKR